MFAALWGAAVALADLNALVLALSAIGCVFVLRDFRVGVVLLVILMPVSRSALFPHAMFGITGLNPVNLLLLATLGSCLLHGLFDGSLRRFVPPALAWLYVLPIVAAGALGTRHLGEIAPGFFMYGLLQFDSVGGYWREYVGKPLLLVVFALLVGAAVAKSEKAERFLVPTLLSIWAMGAMVIAYVLMSGVSLGHLGGSDARQFLSALGLHANDLGRLYAVAYALLLFTCAEARQPGLRLALLASMGVVAVALVLTFSRGAFLAFVAANLIFMLWRRSARTFLAVALAAVFLLVALPEAVYERITTGFDKGLNAITAGRLDGLWLPLLPEVLRSPLFGTGHASILWSEAMRARGGADVIGATHPHSAYLQALLDMGIAGFALLCAYFVHVWKGFRALSVDPALSPTLRGFYQGAAAGLLCVLLSNLTDSSLTPRPEQVFLWLAIGMMYGQRRAGTPP